MTTGRRHVLVIGTQCKSKAELIRLREAARGLHDALREGVIGACESGLPGGESLIYGNLESAAIASLVREAIAHAAEHAATLVLALLGHGFTPGADTALYLMGWESQEGIRDTAVDVRALLIEAADRPGVRSVIGIIDTCTAAAAAPSTAQLATGTRAGQTRLSLLLASAVGQPAYDMRMSRELASLMRTGLAGAGLRLTLGDVKARIQGALAGQDIVKVDYDGAVSSEAEWLAYNRHGSGHALAAASYGMAQLHTVLRALHASRSLPSNLGELRDLYQDLGRESSSPAACRVLRVTDSLIVAHRTVSFLRRYMAAELSSEALRRALTIASGAGGAYPTAETSATLSAEVDVVERVALTYPRKERNCRRQVARFVLALADGAGIDPTQEEFQQWAASIDALVPFNDGLKARAQRQSERRLCLIVSYYSLAGEWPDEVGTWLPYDGKDGGHVNIPCEPDQAGAEEALVEAVDWAEDHAETMGLQLERIEVAMSARMLLEWHPEEVEYGGSRLGVNYRVVSRWSQRLEPTPEMRRINRNVGKRMAEVAGPAKGIDLLHWLAAHQVGDPLRLRAELSQGKHTPVTGLLDKPGQDGSLVDLLLRYVPIVLWPQAASLGPAHCKRVRSKWHLLPDAFLAAYRTRWTDQGSDLIADVRAVWDDEDWLRFCGAAGA